MSKAYDESRYLARTLAVTLLDLEPAQRNEILGYLQQEVERLAHAPNEDASEAETGDAETSALTADNDEGQSGDALKKHKA